MSQLLIIIPGNPKLWITKNCLLTSLLFITLHNSTNKNHKQKLLFNFEPCFWGCFITTHTFFPSYLEETFKSDIVIFAISKIKITFTTSLGSCAKRVNIDSIYHYNSLKSTTNWKSGKRGWKFKNKAWIIIVPHSTISRLQFSH